MNQDKSQTIFASPSWELIQKTRGIKGGQSDPFVQNVLRVKEGERCNCTIILGRRHRGEARYMSFQ